MADFLSATFTGADSTLITSYTGEVGATFTVHPYSPSGSSYILGNKARTYPTSTCVIYASGTPDSADYQVVGNWLYKTDTGGQFGVCGRMSTSANTWYWALWSSGGWKLYKFVAGTLTQLGSTYSQTLTADQTYKLTLDMNGTTIRLLVDDVERVSVTDSAITDAGKAGFAGQEPVAWNSTTGYFLDSITAGTASAAASATKRSLLLGVG